MGTPVLDTSTGRYYDAVLSKSITPADALAQAATLSHRGLTGYLATITSAAENQTVFNLIKALPNTAQGLYVFGASDALVDRTWVWQNGPEKGTALAYTNWDARSNEPNNFWGSVREDYIAINTDAGKWVDMGSAAYDGTGGYVVEYGGLPAAYAITTPSASVIEGTSVIFTIETTNVEWGKTISYAISGITAADLSAGSLTGTAEVNQVGNKNIATVTLTLADDKLAEGSETLTLTVAGVSQAVTVADPVSVSGDSGSTLASAKNMGDWTYNVPALGALTGQEFSETVGGDTDTADFFKFELTQANGMYLNLTSTVGTRFQVQNSIGTAVGTMSLGSSMGMAMGSSNYMINLEPGTYYLRVNTIDSTERAAYTVKTVMAPQDTQNDNLGVYTPTAQKLGTLGMNASLKAQASLWSNYASGPSSTYNMMSGQNSNDAYSFTLSQDAKVKFDLSALKNASYINASISSSNGTSVGSLNLSGMTPATGTTGTTGGNPDQAVFEKELLAGTYNISVNGMGLSKYDYASGTSVYLPTQYQLTVSSSASVAVNNDSGSTLASAKNMGDWTYNVPALGALTGQEFSETVGGDTDTADFFKFELTQANGMYLNLTSTVGTRFQVQNSIGTAVGTMSLGSSMGMAMGSSNYMINLEPGTYYLRVNTIDSTERAAYTVKTVMAPQDTQNDNLGVYTPTAQKLGTLGMNASLKAQASLWSNYASGPSSTYNMMSGQNSNDAYSFTLSQDAKVKFDLSALKNASYINASISSSNGTSVGSLNLSGMTPATGTTGTTGGNPDQAVFEKELLAGTYNISVNGMGLSKYDYASGTSVYLPTQYQLAVSTGAGGGADTTAPTLTVTSNKNSVQVGDTAVLSFAFSEKPVGFELADITVSNGTVSELKVSANDSSLYTANFSPLATASQGAAISVSVAAGSYQDAAGNLGTAFTLSTMKVVVPSYSVAASASAVDEGGTLTFTLSTQNLTPGAVVPYTLSGTGISSGDIDGGVLSGSLKIDASGKAILLVGLLADKLTEGAETLSFTAGGQSTSVSVKDTSTAASTATPGVLFTEAINLKTTEAGGKAQFKVALASAPRYDVKLTLTSNDTSEGLFVLSANSGAQTTAATQALTFTPANWSQAQTVSLIGVDDADTDGAVAYVISSKIASDDLNYDGMRAGQGIVVANLIAENIDDDNPDEVSGTPGNDVLTGGPGPSDVYGFLGRDEMYGGKGDDRLYGGYGDDVLYGEDGNDSLEGEQGSDKLHGGSGKDSLTGGSGNDSLFGGDGDDVLDGEDGADAMDGGKGADTYYVDNPGDTVTDSGADGALDTVYIAAYLGKTYEMGKGLVNATLGALAGPGGLAGNASDNKLEGNTQNNTLSGGLGSDTIAGGGGNDSIDGGDGNDTVMLSGDELDYSITTDTNKLLTYLTSKISGEVTTVSGVEFVQFKDTLKSILSTVKGDTTAPTLSASSPAGNASNVSANTNLTLGFSEQVQAGSGSVVIKRAGANDRSINISDVNQVIFAGNKVVINPTEDLDANTAYTVELASGVIQDLSGNAYAGLSGYSFTTQAASNAVPVANQFVGLSNVKLVKDVAGNKSTVSFSITLNDANLSGQKVSGMLLDMDFDHSKVTSARVSGAQYDSEGSATPVWQFITPNMQGASANGKIVALANTDPANPIVVGGKTLDVTLGLNQAVDSFKIGFNKQTASVVTADGVDRAVGTAADVTAVPNQSYMLKASTVHWKNLAAGTAKALTDVSFVKGSQTLKSSSAGQAVFEASTDSQASMVVGKSVAESEKAAAAAAVNLTDAIAILKMIVGLNVNASGPLSPYQVVAADYNRDGGVGLTDAIDVLKAVVGLNAPAPSWVVLDQSKVASSLTMDGYNADANKLKDSGWMSPTLSVDLDKTPEIKLVGVLAGDVDGSWAG